MEFCRRIGKSWKELADLFGVLLHEKERFGPGDEPRDCGNGWKYVRDFPSSPTSLRKSAARSSLRSCGDARHEFFGTRN